MNDKHRIMLRDDQVQRPVTVIPTALPPALKKMQRWPVASFIV